MRRVPLLAALALALLCAGAVAAAAQGASPTGSGGLWQQIIETQRQLTAAMTRAVRQLQTGDLATQTAILAIISFLYGVLHAVGPGHGKFVISSYALASERLLRRGVLLSFMAAFVQAISAIAIVGTLAIALKVSSVELRGAERWLETASWGLIALFGVWLLWQRVRALRTTSAAAVGHHQDHHHAHDHHHGHAHDNHGHGPNPRHGEAGHVHGPECGHTHLPAAAELDGAWSWSRAWSLALAIGIRPCTGAIAVLLFALNLGLLWAGVLATFTMAIGTAITVSALAMLAVGSRELAVRLFGTESRTGAAVRTGAGLVGSALVLLIGATFFVASLQAPAPL